MRHVDWHGLRALIGEDVGNRGLATDSESNLLNAFPEDLRSACQSIAQTPKPGIGVVTGFFIPDATPPAAETDGPLGALYVARALAPLGIRVALLTDNFASVALQAGLKETGLVDQVPLLVLPEPSDDWSEFESGAWRDLLQQCPLTHLVAIARVGPSPTLASKKQQYGDSPPADFTAVLPKEKRDRCLTMRGRDVTDKMSPVHRLFEHAASQQPPLVTIGIGDGGNEIGMGKIPWGVLHRNVRGGAHNACRVACDYLIVCGICNWGGYALAAGVRALLEKSSQASLFDPVIEKHLLEVMVRAGPLIDGVSGRPELSVDGQPFDRYVEKLTAIERLIA